MIVPFIRDRIDGPTPMHAFDPPQPGTGKSLRRHGRVSGAGREPAAKELRTAMICGKWVTAMSMAGELVILIDNINARLAGPRRRPHYQGANGLDRMIGTSRLALRAAFHPLWPRPAIT